MLVNIEERLLPTGKKHISFSEMKNWKECPYRHKLLHIDKVDLSEPSPFLDFGTAVHEGCESLVEKKEPDRKKLILDIRKAWETHGFDEPEWIKKQPDWYLRSSNVGVEKWIEWAGNMWDDIPAFMNKEFPGWETVVAEEQLYEPIEEHDAFFKGFIDAIIKVPKTRGSGYTYWILDWKTSNSYGWRREKKQDILMTAQLLLYKHFWSKKHNVPLKDIRCGFILLKRGGKVGSVCDIVKVSSVEKSLEKALKIMNSMLTMLKKNIFLKNRLSCTYCVYKDTEHCS